MRKWRRELDGEGNLHQKRFKRKGVLGSVKRAISKETIDCFKKKNVNFNVRKIPRREVLDIKRGRAHAERIYYQKS